MLLLNVLPIGVRHSYIVVGLGCTYEKDLFGPILAFAYAAPCAGYVLCTGWPFQIRAEGCASDVCNQLPLLIGLVAFAHSLDVPEVPVVRSLVSCFKSYVFCLVFVVLQEHTRGY